MHDKIIIKVLLDSWPIKNWPLVYISLPLILYRQQQRYNKSQFIQQKLLKAACDVESCKVAKAIDRHRR